MKLLHLILIPAVCFFLPVWAESPTTAYPLLPPPLSIYDATISLAEQGGSTAASMVIHNPGTNPVVINGATSPFAGRVVMQHYIRQNGVTQIYPLTHIDIPAHADLAVVPLGLEIRLLEATQPLTYGMDVPLTLTFADGSTRTLRLTVQNPDE
ncbi:MAG: copper chaperone PCu(A)C [Alphaproteobacteria bacterium]